VPLYPHKIPEWFQSLFPEYIWRIHGKSNTLFLTFDDGPHPNSTHTLLSLLKQNDVRATFFCSGKQAETHPELLREIQHYKHHIGSHGYAHLNGWKHSKNTYLKDLEKAEKILTAYTKGNVLFRPPYGKIPFFAAKEILRRYKTVLWNYNSGDFDKTLPVDKSIRRLKNVPDGSIILFHDSPKTQPTTIEILSALLPYWKNKGFEFAPL
jgi:peptidoglycan/xylan/chitin deacetylase (PgdA/CDA1 family)